MYRPTLTFRDKGGAMLAVAGIHAGLIFALLHLSGTVDLTDPQQALRVFDINEVVPPPPPPPPPPRQQRPAERPNEKQGGSEPENIRSEATPIVAPEPPIVLPTKQEIAVAETPREGTAPTQGMGNRPGPGTGAGGTGTGTGGGSGSGSGSGGDGGAVTRAQLLTPSLRMRDYPSELRRRFPRGNGPFVIFTVQPNGRVSNCRTYQTSGDPEIDRITCWLVTQRFVYRPALNRHGEPVASQAAYRQGD